MNILEDATYSVKMQIITRFSQIKIIIPYLINQLTENRRMARNWYVFICK